MNEAIILAGGFGTRLRSLVHNLPKPLAPVGNRPFLAWLLDELALQGYSHFILATGYMHEAVETAIGHSFRGIPVDYAVETTPLGTGGAIVNAFQFCSQSCATVLNGDTLFRIDHSRFRSFALLKDTPLALVLRPVPDASRYGTVITNPDGRITAFREKDPSTAPGAINGGIYRIRRQLLDHYAPGQPFSFEQEILQRQYDHIPFFAYPDNAYFIDIGIPADYLRAQTEVPTL